MAADKDPDKARDEDTTPAEPVSEDREAELTAADDAAAPEDTSGSAAAGSEGDPDPADEVTVAAASPAAGAKSAAKMKKADKAEKSEKKPAKPPVSVAKAKARPSVPADSSRTAVLAFLAGILVVAAVAAIAVLYLQLRDRDQELSAGRESAEAACRVVRGFVSYDATKQNMDEWAQKLTDQGTENWKQKFMPVFQELKAGILDQQVKSVPRDVQCGVAKVEDDKKSTKVVVSVYQVVQSKATQGRSSRQLSGMTATMKKVDGRWLVEDLDSQLFHDQ